MAIQERVSDLEFLLGLAANIVSHVQTKNQLKGKTEEELKIIHEKIVELNKSLEQTAIDISDQIISQG